MILVVDSFYFSLYGRRQSLHYLGLRPSPMMPLPQLAKLTWEEKVALLLINQYGWHGVHNEMFLRYWLARSIEIPMRLKTFCRCMEGVPQHSSLGAHIREEYLVLCLQHIKTFDAGYLLNGWTRHSYGVRQKFLFCSVSAVDKLLLAFYAAQLLISEDWIRYIIIKLNLYPIKQKELCLGYLQHNRWIRLDIEVFANGRKTSTINFRYPHVGVDQRLGHMCPYWFGSFAVAAPWGIEHHKPLSFMAHIDEAVTQLQDTGAHSTLNH